MKNARDLLRPIFRLVTKSHIEAVCRMTQKEFEKYKGKYEGQRCFVVANGPSLCMEDLDCLADKGEITFGMNRIYVIYDRTKWKPTFYIVQDPTVIRSCHNEIRKQVNNSVVFAKVPGEHKYDIPGAINFKIDYSKSDKHLPPDFYDGKDCQFADGKTVTYTCLQLAIYMGFKEIYLIGADCNYSLDNKNISKDSYPDSRMYAPDKIGMPPDMAYTFATYEVAKAISEKRGVKIYNATRGGKLEVFERVSLDSLLRERELDFEE